MGVIQLSRKKRDSSLQADDLQIVVIDSFYDAVIRGDENGWLSKLFQFKVNSFLASYPYGMLSFGTADLIGTHWILCRKEERELRPVMAFKTIDTNRTDAFRMDFPGFEPVKEPGLETHRAAITRELEKTRELGYPLAYIGSWVVDPGVRQDRFLSTMCRKASSALFSQWIHTFDVQTLVTFASLRFHVEKFHAYLGMTRLNGPNGEQLPDFKMRGAFDEPLCASVMYRANHSKESNQDRLDLSALWERRIVIAPEQSPLRRQTPTTPAAEAA